MEELKAGDVKIFITSFPSGKAELVKVLGENTVNNSLWYITRQSGGTDMTSKEFLHDVPEGLNTRADQSDKLIDELVEEVEKLKCQYDEENFGKHHPIEIVANGKTVDDVLDLLNSKRTKEQTND